ncbi:hypothetical protein Plhal710r2_c054g0161641 [Plasmopara halstedii]
MVCTMLHPFPPYILAPLDPMLHQADALTSIYPTANTASMLMVFFRCESLLHKLRTLRPLQEADSVTTPATGLTATFKSLLRFQSSSQEKRDAQSLFGDRLQ